MTYWVELIAIIVVLHLLSCTWLLNLLDYRILDKTDGLFYWSFLLRFLCSLSLFTNIVSGIIRIQHFKNLVFLALVCCLE
jgi:hypothetical protein